MHMHMHMHTHLYLSGIAGLDESTAAGDDGRRVNDDEQPPAIESVLQHVFSEAMHDFPRFCDEC